MNEGGKVSGEVWTVLIMCVDDVSNPVWF